MRALQRAEDVAQRIAQVVDDNPDPDKRARGIIKAVRGCGCAAWHILDEQPGRIWEPSRHAWHPFLRQVRNHPKHGRALLSAITTEVSHG